MAAPSMVSRDGENTIVKSVDAVFGASDDDDDDGEDNESGQEGGSEEGGSAGEEGEPAELPQCKIKRNYTCSMCDYFTQNPRFYLYHQKQVHKEKIKIFECPNCLYASKHSQKLQRHIHMVHIMGKKKLSKAKVRMMKKAAKIRRSAPPKPPPPMPSSQGSEEELNDDEFFHPEDEDDFEDRPEPMFGVDGTRVFKCSVCDMLSKSEALITKHERVVHLKKRFFRCTKCNYMTHMKARYTKHVKYHSMPMIKCDMCDFKTPYKWNLDRHNKNHQGDGAFKCVMCNFAADIKQSLTVHEMNHHVPPVGHLAGNRRRLRVGASDTMGMFTEEDGIDDDELNLLRMEREGSLEQMEQNPADFLQTQLEEPPSPPPDSQFPLMKMSMRQVLVPVGKAFETNSSSGFIQIQKYKCKFCDFSGNLGEVQRHETSVHGGFGELGGAGKKAPTPVKRPIPNLIPIQGQSGAKPASDRKSDQEDGPGVQPDPNESFKRKNASFFDKLKEKLMTNSGERDLTCALCGYEAKCLSEHLKHHKSHSEEEGVSQGELSSTRCQHCRQRCKTSADLVLHLQTCSAALGDSDNFTTELKNDSMDAEENHQMEEDSVDGGRSTHPMENKVFVWNNFTQEKETKQMPFEMNFYQPRAEDREAPAARAETSPPPHQIYTSNGAPFDSPPPYFAPKETTRKVFKCPSCSFWASTASRFHVHIVGHLNKRPFQCSLCHYSSNWRWDITKHIRLKQMRDAAHEKARVLLTDEAGRRNYSKYNRYLVPISIEEFRKAQVPRRGGIPKENSDPSERRVVIGKRPPEENNEEEEERPKKKPFPENKKTMWKCKKCLFRNSDRSVVLAHVKDHYRSLSEGKPFTPIDNKNQQEKEDSPPRDSLENKEEEEEVRAAREAAGDDTIQCPDFMCETCPFACDSLKTLQEHAERHFVSQSTNVRCQFCPYYAESSQALLHHLDLHLDQNPDSADDPKRNMVYPCSDCPFKGKTREQLVYHQKYHKKDYPQKCFKCDYSTETNIILSLHVRLHGRGQPPTEQSTTKEEIITPILDAELSGIDTSSLSEIPMVWVSKPMGISKMFKCRFCPHVNMRKANIQDHEKLHKAKNCDSVQHRCPHCSFICNNAALLASHSKVHQTFQGQVCGIVDHRKPDEKQIDEMKKRVVEYQNMIGLKITSIEDELQEEEKILAAPTITEADSKDGLLIHFCPVCPARYLFLKEIVIHSRLHSLNLPFKCPSCTYNARQKAHLMAHMKTHTDDYKERTSALSNLYPTHVDYPKPKVVVILGKPEESSWNWKDESVWVAVREGSDGHIDDLKENRQRKKKPLSCDKCPAEFFKEIALSYHSSLHGGPGPHKCKYCDYAVKTYGNLLRHEAIHAKSESPVKLSLRAGEIPVSGTDLFNHKTEAQRGSPQKNHSRYEEDPEFGSLIFGNPDFTYPTYVKNGKLRGKRYKCHKCPSAFEKREQYKIHLSLHGSRQRYSCDKCDYSVKYFANYSQHMKKHNFTETHKKHNGVESLMEEKDEEIPETITPERAAKSLKISVADQQTSMIMQGRNTCKKVLNPSSETINRCPHCPYANNRKEGVSQSHLKCHSSTKKGPYACKYCDYSVPQAHFLRDHLKMHFSSTKFLKPDAFLQCNKLQIWCEPVDSNHNNKKSLVFKDTESGDNGKRFIPKLEKPDDFENLKGRVYINLKTGEEEVETDDEGDKTERGVENGGDVRREEDGTVEEGGESESQGEESSSESRLSSGHSDAGSTHSHD